MMHPRQTRMLVLAAVLVAGALIAFLGWSRPAAAATGGALDRPVDTNAPGVEEEWKLVSALDLAQILEQDPRCELPGGLDHVANGGGARNEGHTTVRLRGAPAGAVPVVATLYVGLIDATAAPTITVSFEGHPLTAALVGTSANPCWGPGVYALYSVDVLPFVPQWINGDYQVSGIPTARNDGGDPWATFDLTPPLAEGTTLVVTYSHASVPPHSMVYTHAGPSTFIGGSLTLVNTLAPPLPGSAFLRHTRIGADGQVGSGISPIAPIATDTTAINGIPIKGLGAPANQDSDWNGSDGGPLNQLWDTHTSDVAGTMAAGDALYLVTYASPSDCVSPSVHVLTAF